MSFLSLNNFDTRNIEPVNSELNLADSHQFSFRFKVLMLQCQITMNRSLQIFYTQFLTSLKFNLPPSKAILLERMSADLRVSPSHLLGTLPNLAPEEGGICVKNPSEHFFFRSINLRKKGFCFHTSKNISLMIASVNTLS